LRNPDHAMSRYITTAWYHFTHYATYLITYSLFNLPFTLPQERKRKVITAYQKWD